MRLKVASALARNRSRFASCLIFIGAQLAFGQQPPPNLVTYFTDPAPSISSTPNPDGTTHLVLRKELSGYGNYGVNDGSSDILYTGEVATWKYTLPSSVDPNKISSASFRASLIADDHYGVDLAAYRLAVWANGGYLGDSLANLPHGSPYGTRFTNWMQRDYQVSQSRLAGPFSLTLFNTSGTGNWFAVDWIELHLTLETAGPETLSINDVRPRNGGNSGVVTLTVAGTGLNQNTSVALSCPPRAELPAIRTTAHAGGRTLYSAFDLRGVAATTCTVIVRNQGGTSATLPNAFNIVAGGAPRLRIEIVGPSATRRGFSTFYAVAVSNESFVDAPATTVFVGAPRGSTIKPVIPLSYPAGAESSTFPIPMIIDTGQQLVLAAITPRIPAGTTVFLPIEVLFPLPGSSVVRLAAQEVSTNETLACASPLQSRAALGELFLTANAWINETLCGGPGPCWTAVVGLIPFVSCYMNQWCYFYQLSDNQPGDLEIARWYGWWGVLSCLSPWASYERAYNFIINFGALMANCPGNETRDEKTVESVTSWDPNDKLGPEGAGTGRFITGSGAHAYTIRFENQPSATAPAREVVITDVLDPATYDFDTVSLGPIVFGDKISIPPANVTAYAANVDLRPQLNIIVGITAGFDKTSGRLSWKFTALDPVTGQPPIDLLAGFLPPNKLPPQGEGSVVFSVRSKSTLQTGTQIRNLASIVFDINPPIITPTWQNTIDATVPTSAVQPLASVQNTTTFTVRWQGTDIGSGIAGYDIYVSDNGGAYTRWQSNTSATEAAFTGTSGHTYAFYGRARDLADNIETPKTIAEASTRVVLANPPQIVVTRSLSRNSQNSVAINVTLTNTGGATAQTTLVTIGRIGSASAITVLPTSPVNIAAGSSASVILVFPASVGGPGTNTTLTVGGTYLGGSFNFTSRITLP